MTYNLKSLNSSSSSPIRVLHLFTDPATGVLLVSSIARAQVASGFHVEFATGEGENLEKLKSLGFPVTIVPIVRKMIAVSHVRALYKVYQLIRARKYDVIHVHTPIAALLGRMAAKIAKTPVVIHHLRGSWWDSNSKLMKLFFTQVERIAGRWTTHTFTINCSDALDLVRLSGVSAKAVTCLHCGAGGVDLSRFKIEERPNKRQINRDSVGIASDDLVVGFIGRLVKEKGLFELLSAISLLTTAYPQLKLVIVGGTLVSERDQKTGTDIRNRVSMDSSLRDRVIFTGFSDNIPDLLSTFDILVLPSHREAFGMVLGEAAAMGLPVLSSNTRGGKEAVVDGETGFLFPIGDTRELANKLNLLLEDSNLRLRLGTNGRKRAEERFDHLIVQKTISDVYNAIFREKGTRYYEL